MLDELIAAVDTARATYGVDDLTVRITDMMDDGADLFWWVEITFEGDRVSRWMIIAEGVRHSALKTPGYGFPELHTEHGLLTLYGSWAKLRVLNAPADRLALLGQLTEAHGATVGPSVDLCEFLRAGCRAFDPEYAEGSDVLAEGSLALMEVYAKAAGWQGVETVIEVEAAEKAEPTGEQSTEQAEKPAPPLKVFTLGDSWICAKNFVCEQVAASHHDCIVAATSEDEATTDEPVRSQAHHERVDGLHGIQVPESPAWPPFL